MSTLCYECAIYHPESEMQAYDCVECGGRKCKGLHGGEGTHTCDGCNKTNLCIDCCQFARCCHDVVDGEFMKKQQAN